MAAIEASLFTWRDVEARSDLERFYLVRDHLPDERLVQYLEVMRGNGRDDYPVRAMWNAVLAGVDARTAKPWTKIKSWFGYGVHLIADTQYEIPVAVNRRPLAAVCQPVEESGSSQPRTRSVVAAVRLLPVG